MGEHEDKTVIKQVKNELFSFPINEEWDFEKNYQHFPHVKIDTIKPKSGLKVWWLCQKGHSYDAPTRHRTEGLQCPICSNRRLLVGYNDFATRNPELISRWIKDTSNPDPSTIIFGNRTIPINFYCDKGHYYKTNANNLSRKRLCSYCAGSKVLAGFNDIATKVPDAVTLWNYNLNKKSPHKVSYGSKIKYHFVCVKGHEYTTSAYKFSQGQRCANCAGKVIDHTNNLASTHPELIQEWDTEKNTKDVSEISKGHDGKVWWKCKDCSHSWLAHVYNRTAPIRPQGCPKCAKGQRSSKGEREIVKFLKDNNMQDIIQHHVITDKTGKKYELDIFIPSLMIAIEFNGVYYHSDKFVDKNYHKNKYISAKNQGIELLQIWEDDWYRNKENTQLKIINRLTQNFTNNKIEFSIVDIQKEEMSNYTSFIKQGSYQYVKIVTDKTVAAIVIFNQDSELIVIEHYEENIQNSTLFSEVVSQLKSLYHCQNVVAKSDNCFNNEKLYLSNGFHQIDIEEPNHTFLNNKQYRETEDRGSECSKNTLRIYDAGMTIFTQNDC